MRARGVAGCGLRVAGCGLRGCGVAGLRGCGVAAPRGHAVAGYRGCGVDALAGLREARLRGEGPRAEFRRVRQSRGSRVEGRVDWPTQTRKRFQNRWRIVRSQVGRIVSQRGYPNYPRRGSYAPAGATLEGVFPRGSSPGLKSDEPAGAESGFFGQGSKTNGASARIDSEVVRTL